MGLFLTIMSVLNAVLPLMGHAEEAFSGKKGSGKKKKKFVMDAAKVIVATTPLKPAEKTALLTEVSKTVDTVAATSKVVNALKK